MKGYIQYGDRFLTRDTVYAIEYPEAAQRQRVTRVDVKPVEMLELFETAELRRPTPTPEQLYRNAIGK